jgi:hypothetical protein
VPSDHLLGLIGLSQIRVQGNWVRYKEKVTNLVVTPNFDRFLSQALNLFGKEYIVCDHPRTAVRVDPERRELQIVHVHGTYRFYDLCNIYDEIEIRSDIDTGEDNMATLLNSILATRSPIVIGYGGWEGDVIMSALKRRLKSGGLPYNIYWFCYQEEDLHALPAWLKGDMNVLFVLPEVNPSVASHKYYVIVSSHGGGAPGKSKDKYRA